MGCGMLTFVDRRVRAWLLQDLVAIAGIDCVISTTFYFDFVYVSPAQPFLLMESSMGRSLTLLSLSLSRCISLHASVTVILVVLTLSVITAYFYAGMQSYSAKLLLIPRNCLKCGLPVLKGEKVRNDEASMNPITLARAWWRGRQELRTADPQQRRASVATAAAKEQETRRLKREFGMSQVKTPKLGVFRSVHTQCPTKHVLSGKILERTIRSNLRVWQARVKLRMNYLTYRNRCLKLYCWVALFLYPTVSKTILMIFNCQEIGDTRYLVVDRRIVCYNSTWAIFGVIAMAGVVVWVVGIPFFFWILIRLAQDRGVAARLRLLRKPQCRRLRKKWLKEVLQQHADDGVCVPDMDNIDVQDEELAKYMKRKNLTVDDDPWRSRAH